MAHLIKIQQSADKAPDTLLKKPRANILQAVKALANNPRPHGHKKLKGKPASVPALGRICVLKFSNGNTPVAFFCYVFQLA
jgi:hypothetical protein